MSDLIEKAARKMVDAYAAQFGAPDHVTDGTEDRWKAFVPETRAAIAAVAEWLDPKQMPSLLANTPAEIISARLRNELEQPK